MLFFQWQCLSCLHVWSGWFGRGAYESTGVPVLPQDSGEVVFFLPQVVLPSGDGSGSVEQAFDQSPLDLGWMVGVEVKVPVCVCGFPVDGDVQATIIPPLEQDVKKGEPSVLLHLHSEPDGWSHAVQVGQELFHCALLHNAAGVSYGGDFFEQREGAAMGSPVSAVVADLYMEFFEELALRTAPTKPRLWKRYVDDTCCIVKKGTVEELLTHLNSVRPSIRFTVEVEKDGRLPFLDILLQRRDDGSLDVTVYRKPTHTDRYLDFHSHHPPQVKRGLVKCLFDRARTITTGQNNLRKEEHHLTRVLRQNGYPSTFIRSSSKPPRPDMEATEALPLEEEHRPPLVMLPYIEGVNEDVKRVCRKFGMKVVFRSGQSLRSMLTKVKDPPDDREAGQGGVPRPLQLW